MPKFATGFIDGSADITYNFVDKEFLIESFPQLMNQGKIPTLWLWGRSNYGNLGDNTRINKSSPVQTISTGTNWKQISSAGWETISGVKTDGTLWIWGDGGFGVLGDNTTVSKSSPVQTLGSATTWCFASGSAGVKSDGTLWVWGANFGTLGDGTTIHRSSPVQTSTGGTNWRSLSTGGYGSNGRTTGATKADGTLWMWGDATGGSVGNNQALTVSCPVQTTCGGNNWKMVSVGCRSVGATKTDGTLWTWGCNSYGALGDNSIVSRSTPVQVSTGGTNWRFVASGFRSMAAIKNDGTLWTWGNNICGQLATNSIVNSSTPAQTVSGGSNWRTVTVLKGGNFGSSVISMSAIKSDGTLWSWGSNNVGQLGDNTTVNKSSPVQTVSGGTNWRSVIFGGFCMVGAIRDLDAD